MNFLEFFLCYEKKKSAGSGIFFREKSLSLQKQRKHYSIVSIIRDLIERDRLKRKGIK